MVDFAKLEIDKAIIKEIENIGNSCGVISCYVLSLIYDFKFNIHEFNNIGNGLTSKQIQEYARKNGVSSLSKEQCGNKTTVNYADYDLLLKNNIVIDLAATNFWSGNISHTSILTSINGDLFQAIYSDNSINQFSKLENLYLTFYYKNNEEIHEYINWI